jgi:single-strand DNA-binding protein
MVFDPSQLCIIEFGDRTLTVRYRFFKLLIITNMNALRNKVSLIGRLGAQPEVTTFETGRTLARFTLAVNEGYKDKDGNWQDNTQWHTINAWGRTADRVKKALNKGQEVMIEGKLVNQSYETKSGEKRYSTIIEATEFLLLSPKSESTPKQ